MGLCTDSPRRHGWNDFCDDRAQALRPRAGSELLVRDFLFEIAARDHLRQHFVGNPVERKHRDGSVGFASPTHERSRDALGRAVAPGKETVPGTQPTKPLRCRERSLRELGDLAARLLREPGKFNDVASNGISVAYPLARTLRSPP